MDHFSVHRQEQGLSAYSILYGWARFFPGSLLSSGKSHSSHKDTLVCIWMSSIYCWGCVGRTKMRSILYSHKADITSLPFHSTPTPHIKNKQNCRELSEIGSCGINMVSYSFIYLHGICNEVECLRMSHFNHYIMSHFNNLYYLFGH